MTEAPSWRTGVLTPYEARQRPPGRLDWVTGAHTQPAVSATVEKDLSSGQTVAQIASAQNVRIADVHAAYPAAIQNQPKTAAAQGTIAQAHSDKAYAAIRRAVVSGKYPLPTTRRPLSRRIHVERFVMRRAAP
jgi:hypothetical protein